MKMRRITGLIATTIALAVASSAFAQVDCSVPGGCATTKYGLGLKPEYRKDEVPPDSFRYDDAYFGADFGGVSYLVTRSNLGVPVGTCGPERNQAPGAGQVLLREQVNCVPTSEGPLCSAGTNAGKTCHLPTLNQGCIAAGNPSACCTGAGRGTCSGFQSSATNLHECGTGGVCTLDDGTGCRVEIVLSDGGITPPADTSEIRVAAVQPKSPSPVNGQLYTLSAATGNTIGGTSIDGVDAEGRTCTVSSSAGTGNVRRKPSMGTRFLLPPSHPEFVAGGNRTYIRWDSNAGLEAASYTDLATGFRMHTDDSAVCCGPDIPGLATCSFVPFQPEYPLLSERNCTQTFRFVNEDNVVPDWVFAGGREAAFHMDKQFVLPGQIPGVCKNNRFTACYATNVNSHCVAAGRAFDRPLACCTGLGTGTCSANTFCTATGTPFQCCTGPGAGNCGDPCPGLGDTCDLTQHGVRVQTGAGNRIPYVSPGPTTPLDGDSRRDWCGWALFVMRGQPGSGCSLLPRLDYDGDPGPDCGVLNYGIDARDDNNCNGVADFPDLCPRNSEWDQDLDTDGDCGTPGSAGYPSAACRGNECECGDQAGSGVLAGTIATGNGLVNVSDLVGINSAIFGTVVQLRLCDANNDTLCNVSDIVGTNREIFIPDSSLCRQITPRQCLTGVPAPCCGNGLLETSEICDDGDLAPGDGCNAACRVEFGFTCTPTSPSVCTQN
jgi:cysteine-rich repeat protein